MANEKPQGNGNAVPEQEQPNWLSLDKAEKLQKYLFKNFVKKGDDKDAKKFFYRVIGMHKSAPAGIIASSDKFLIHFEVQKYHRNKMVKVTKRDEGANQIEVSENMQVDGHEMRDGNWACVDETASFFKDSEKFLAEFEGDKVE